MPTNLEDYLNSLPEWHDENKIIGLFAAFPPNRNVNPEVWDSRMLFWKQLILQTSKLSLLSPDSLVINRVGLEKKFQRNGLTPLGLDVVVKEMLRNGDLASLEYLEEKSFLYIIFEKITKLPYLNDIFNANSGHEYLLLSTLAEVSSKMQAEHAKATLHSIDSIITIEEFRRLFQIARCQETTVSSIDCDLMLRYMKGKGLIEYDFIDSSSKTHENLVIKFVYKQKTGITESCKGIAKMKLSVSKIEKQIKDLEKKVESSHYEVIDQLRKKNKKMAVLSLKREKLLKDILEKRSCSLSSIEEVLFKIRSSEMDAEIIDVFSIASSTLQGIIKKNGLSVEKVEKVMDEMQDLLADQNEIDDALKISYNSINSIDEEELEKDLDALLAEEKNELSEVKPQEIHNPHQGRDLLKELESLVTSCEVSPPPTDTNEALQQINQLSMT